MIFHKYQKCTRAKKSKITMVHKYQQCTRTYFFGQMIGHSFKNIFDSLGFAYDFAFCQNNGSPNIEIIPWKKNLYTLRNDDLFGGVWWVQEKVKFLDFQNVQIWKDNIFLRCFHIFSCIFWSILVINTGGEGPLRVQNFEIFGSSQNGPLTIAIGPGTLISHFGIIKTPTMP